MTDNDCCFMTSFATQFAWFANRGMHDNPWYKNTYFPASAQVYGFTDQGYRIQNIVFWRTPMIQSREIIRQADRKWFKTQDWSAFNNHWGKDITGRGWGTGAGDTPNGYGVEKIGNDGGSKGKHKILEFS